MKKYSFLLLLVLHTVFVCANSILIPMDNAQRNHLKAYGLAYYALKQNVEVDWLMNYRGGSFLISFTPAIQSECTIRGISFELISSAKNKCDPYGDCKTGSKHECDALRDCAQDCRVFPQK